MGWWVGVLSFGAMLAVRGVVWMVGARVSGGEGEGEEEEEEAPVLLWEGVGEFMCCG